MASFSRRQLAKYAVDEMINGKSAASLASRLAATLIASHRQKEVDLLLSDIDQELEERDLLVRARVTSAYPLSAELKRQLTAQLKKMTEAKDVALQEQIDNSVIGGFRVDTATHSWDKTLMRALRQLKETA
jgi:F0F1-type ATP synthase delta subunit